MTSLDVILDRAGSKLDSIRSARADWASASDEARDEVRKYRSRTRAGRRTLGEGAARIVSVESGELLTGDEVVERQVTEALEALTEKALGQSDDVVRGVGATFGNLYEFADRYGPYLEEMGRDAFNESLRLPELQCSLCRSHEGMGMATTRGSRFFLDTDDTGLLFAAAVDVREADAAEMVMKLRNGSTPADTSVGAGRGGYAGEWDDSYTSFTILRWSLSGGEISVLRAGANPGGWAEALRGSDMDEKGMDEDKGMDDEDRAAPNFDIDFEMELASI